MHTDSTEMFNSFLLASPGYRTGAALVKSVRRALNRIDGTQTAGYEGSGRGNHYCSKLVHASRYRNDNGEFYVLSLIRKCVLCKIQIAQLSQLFL